MSSSANSKTVSRSTSFMSTAQPYTMITTAKRLSRGVHQGSRPRISAHLSLVPNGGGIGVRVVPCVDNLIVTLTMKRSALVRASSSVCSLGLARRFANALVSPVWFHDRHCHLIYGRQLRFTDSVTFLALELGFDAAVPMICSPGGLLGRDDQHRSGTSGRLSFPMSQTFYNVSLLLLLPFWI